LAEVWRNFQCFLANVDAKAVKCFANNRTEDMKIASKALTENLIQILCGWKTCKAIIVAYPEVDSQFRCWKPMFERCAEYVERCQPYLPAKPLLRQRI